MKSSPDLFTKFKSSGYIFSSWERDIRLKQDDWLIADKTFFLKGACHILAKVFLERYPSLGFHAYEIYPSITNKSPYHIFVSDGTRAFDAHGYTNHQELVSRKQKEIGNCVSSEKMSINVMPDDFMGHALHQGLVAPASFLLCPFIRAHRFIDILTVQRNRT